MEGAEQPYISNMWIHDSHFYRHVDAFISTFNLAGTWVGRKIEDKLE